MMPECFWEANPLDVHTPTGIHPQAFRPNDHFDLRALSRLWESTGDKGLTIMSA